MYSIQLKKLVSGLSIVLISGCSMLPDFSPDPVEVIKIQTVTVEAKIVHPSLPRPIDLKEPKWKVVSAANLDTFLVEMKKEGGNQLVFVAMSIGDYELMAYNMQEIKRYVGQQKEVIIYYRTLQEDGE